MNILIIHYTLPNYRVDVFNEIAKKSCLDVLFYAEELNRKIYNDIDRTKYLENINIMNDEKVEFNIKTKKYDCIVLPTPDSITDIKVFIKYKRLAMLNKVKTIVFWERWEMQPQTSFTKIKRMGYHQLLKYIFKDIDLFLAAGKKSYEFYKSIGIHDTQLKIVGDSSDISSLPMYSDIREEYKIVKDMKIVLYYGRIIERKGLKFLLDAHKLLENENVFLLICGDGPEKQVYEDYANNLNLINYKFVGYVSPELRKNFFYQSDVFVLPSYLYKDCNEAWGLTLNESISCGTPIVSTDAVGSSFDLINENNGIMVKEKEVYELYEAIMKILAHNYSKTVVSKSIEGYSSTQVAEKITDAIKNLF